MNCPSCQRNLASGLSVCPSCGTMIFDSVREELALKISPIIKPLKVELPLKSEVKEKPTSAAPIAKPIIPPTSSDMPAPSKTVAPAAKSEVTYSAPVQNQVATTVKTETAEIASKATSPTLVEFQNKNAVLPDWRLQLQNSVRRRQSSSPTTEAVAAQPRTMMVTSGATALKAEIVPEEIPATQNSTLSNALKRIEESRQRYLTEEKSAETISTPAPAAPRNFPYAVPNKTPEFAAKKAEPNPNPAFQTKPKAATILTEVKPPKFDTNKLPPLTPKAKISSDFEQRPAETKTVAPIEIEVEDKYLHIKADPTPEVMAYSETTIDEFDEETDDRAPLGLRFNAGVFDLIVGAVISAILLAPFMLTSENLYTFQSLLAFLATCSIVMFIYLTTTIGTNGRTFGMRLFSLEIVDIEQNAYPTFHQAAVSSSVYLVSLALGGIGYLTMFLNDEKRAAHDLVSGTIIVKEYE